MKVRRRFRTCEYADADAYIGQIMNYLVHLVCRTD